MALPTQDLRLTYTIDAFDRLIEVNPTFVAALQLAAPALLRSRHLDSCPARLGPLDVENVQGRSLWDFVSGVVPRQLWQILYSRVRGAGAPVFVPLRADTASRRCLIDLELYPASDRSIRHVGECLWSEERAAVALLDPDYPRDARQLVRCGWCARIQLSLGSWHEVEDAHVRLGLGTADTLPTVRDGVCTPCKQSLLKNFPLRVA